MTPQNIIAIILLIISIILLSVGIYEYQKDNTNLYRPIKASIYDLDYETKQTSSTYTTYANKLSTTTTTYKTVYDIYDKYTYTVNNVEYKGRRFVRRVYSFGEVDYYRKQLTQSKAQSKFKQLNIYYLISNPNISVMQPIKNNSTIYFVSGAFVFLISLGVAFATPRA